MKTRPRQGAWKLFVLCDEPQLSLWQLIEIAKSKSQLAQLDRPNEVHCCPAFLNSDGSDPQLRRLLEVRPTSKRKYSASANEHNNSNANEEVEGPSIATNTAAGKKRKRTGPVTNAEDENVDEASSTATPGAEEPLKAHDDHNRSHGEMRDSVETNKEEGFTVVTVKVWLKQQQGKMTARTMSRKFKSSEEGIELIVENWKKKKMKELEELANTFK
eukprot:GHVL01008120.1.p2 GENE.GHVL01008120.1~~GHVL01008120.1.p2  ORF type:complete len:216 (+),score=48.39 GHVL01008120.1:123-770(+)